jgi:hypothetical protein
MRNDEMLRHRDHVVTQLVGVLDHRRLLRSGHGELQSAVIAGNSSVCGNANANFIPP